MEYKGLGMDMFGRCRRSAWRLVLAVVSGTLALGFPLGCVESPGAARIHGPMQQNGSDDAVREIFRNVGSVCIVVGGQRGDAPERPLPFGETAERALRYAGVKASIGDRPDCPARLSMDAELSAVPKMYAPLVWSSSSDTKVAYTGARIRLRMKLSVQDRIETVELDHEEEPRPSIPPDGCCSKPSDAPFENLYFEKVAPGLLRTLMLATQPVLLVNAVDGSAGDESRRFHDASVEAARGTRDPELVRCLARALLREKDESARQRIASVLKDSWAKEGIDLLVAALGSVDTEDRRRAAEALGGIGDSRAGRPLVQALEDPERSVRSAAMVSLGKLSYRDAVPSLIRIFSNTAEDRSLRNLAGIVLDGLAATHTEKLPEPERIKLWQSRTKP